MARKPREAEDVIQAACLSWHPDKNLKHQVGLGWKMPNCVQAVATEVFQFLQAVKDWYFE